MCSACAGYFWHVTDMHWDPTYVSSDVRPMSCGSANPSGVYSPYGDYRCDAPWSLINSSVYATRQLRQDVDFLIWTGCVYITVHISFLYRQSRLHT